MFLISSLKKYQHVRMDEHRASKWRLCHTTQFVIPITFTPLWNCLRFCFSSFSPPWCLCFPNCLHGFAVRCIRFVVSKIQVLKIESIVVKCLYLKWCALIGMVNEAHGSHSYRNISINIRMTTQIMWFMNYSWLALNIKRIPNDYCSVSLPSRETKAKLSNW